VHLKCPFKFEYVNVDVCLPTCLFVKLHGCLMYSAYTNYIKNYNPKPSHSIYSNFDLSNDLQYKLTLCVIWLMIMC
jgi:hypothetical protein